MEEKQTRRQSKDFNEIWNIQSEMNVSNETWDELFHNWDNPMECKGRKRPTGCTICELIEKNGCVIRKSTGETYDKKGKLVICQRTP
jgi:hypothetical protein